MFHGITRNLVFTLFCFFHAGIASAAINQWTYDSSYSIVESDNPCADGADVSAVPYADLSYLDLSHAYLAGKDISYGNLSHTLLAPATLKSANLTGANLTGDYLAGCDWSYTILNGANLSNVTLDNSNFLGSTLTFSQLQTTASYKNKNLINVCFGSVVEGNDLTGWDFTGQNLSYSRFTNTTLTNTVFTDAKIQNAFLDRITAKGFTQSQLQSTASYKNRNLQDIYLTDNNLSGWDFHGQDLTWAYLDFCDLSNANFSHAVLYYTFFDSSNLTGANFTGADLREVRNFSAVGATMTNAILFDGTIDGLHLTKDAPLLVVHNTSLIPIHVTQAMQVDDEGILDLVFDDGKTWQSTMSFDPGISVALGGKLLLDIDAQDPESLVGVTFQLFDWNGVSPTGHFSIVSDAVWDTDHLYDAGTITLLAVPEPAALALVGFALALGAWAFLRRRRCA